MRELCLRRVFETRATYAQMSLNPIRASYTVGKSAHVQRHCPAMPLSVNRLESQPGAEEQRDTADNVLRGITPNANGHTY